jgi:hypothetical protein
LLGLGVMLELLLEVVCFVEQAVSASKATMVNIGFKCG